jgi:hypothetical protein
MSSMVTRTLIAFTAAILLFLSTWVVAPAAFALTHISLSDLSYQQCPPELAAGAVTSGGVTQEANCFLIVGKANNPSGKTVYDADVYGRIYDADNNNVFQNRTRVGSIEQVPPGISDFAVRISIPTNLPTPLQLKQFKASGFTAKIRQ